MLKIEKTDSKGLVKVCWIRRNQRREKKEYVRKEARRDQREGKESSVYSFFHSLSNVACDTLVYEEHMEDESNQCKGHTFDPWSGKIPHASGQLSLSSRDHAPEMRSPCNQMPEQCNQRVYYKWRKLLGNKEDPAQPKINKCIKIIFIKKNT